jgi:transposase
LNKYLEQQKLEAVETYRSGDLGLRATAAHDDVDVASLRKWVAAYEAIGIAGIQRKRRQTYDLNFKLEVLQKLKSAELSCR